MRMQNHSYFGQNKMINDRFYDESSIHYNVAAMHDVEIQKQSLQADVLFDPYKRKSRFSFNVINNPFEKSPSWAFPPGYEDHPTCPLQVDVISDRCVRLRMSFAVLKRFRYENESPMLDGPLKIQDNLGSWEKEGQDLIFQSQYMTIRLKTDPFALILYDAKGKELTRTLTMEDSRSLMNDYPLPLSYVLSNIDMRRQSALSLSINPNEHFFGCGEHFKKLDKLGQSVSIETQDPLCSEIQDMYKPIPFFWSTREYGVFIHSGAQMTL